MQNGQVTEHAIKELEHMYNLCWSPDGKYIIATVLGGMGYRHTSIAIEAWGRKYFQLGITGCRPEFSPDGKRIGWGQSDRDFRIAEIDLSKRPPVRQKDIACIIQVTKGYEVYHLDWSPDGKYIAFSCGPDGEQAVGGMAQGWDICILELSTGRWLNITRDGNHNKEPDWVP
jgi:Tol biopolymer transport system component